MFKKIVKRAASFILAIAITVAYVPMVTIAAGEEPVTYEMYQALLDEVTDAEKALLEASVALAVIEETFEELCATLGVEEAELRKSDAEAVKADAETALNEVKAEVDAIEANIVEVQYMVQSIYNADGTVARRTLIGKGTAHRNANRTYTIFTMPENVEELIEEGAIEEATAKKAGNGYRVEYKYTDTSVTANFYVLKEGIDMPEDPMSSQPTRNYVCVGTTTIDTGLQRILGEDSLADIQDIQFDLAGSDTSRYVWYCVKEETTDGWHVDGYIVTEPTEEETTTVVEEETTTVVEEETTTVVEEETTTVSEEETTTVAEEETTTVVEEETTTVVEEETTTVVEEETTTVVEEETTTVSEEETTTVSEEETTTVVEEETTSEILYGPGNEGDSDEYDEPEEETTTTPVEETTSTEEKETTTPVTPVIPVEPEDTPVTPVTPVEPESTPVVDFEDEVTPLAPPTDWAEFEDEETPLDAMPETGSMNLVLPAMAVSCVALVVATVSRKKEDGAAE